MQEFVNLLISAGATVRTWEISGATSGRLPRCKSGVNAHMQINCMIFDQCAMHWNSGNYSDNADLSCSISAVMSKLVKHVDPCLQHFAEVWGESQPLTSESLLRWISVRLGAKKKCDQSKSVARSFCKKNAPSQYASSSVEAAFASSPCGYPSSRAPRPADQRTAPRREPRPKKASEGQQLAVTPTRKSRVQPQGNAANQGNPSSDPSHGGHAEWGFPAFPTEESSSDVLNASCSSYELNLSAGMQQMVMSRLCAVEEADGLLVQKVVV